MGIRRIGNKKFAGPPFARLISQLLAHINLQVGLDLAWKKHVSRTQFKVMQKIEQGQQAKSIDSVSMLRDLSFGNVLQYRRHFPHSVVEKL